MGILQLLLMLLLLLGGYSTSSFTTVEEQRPPRTSQNYEIAQMIRYSRPFFANDAWQQMTLATNSAYVPVVVFSSGLYGAVAVVGSASGESEVDYRWLDVLMTNYAPWALEASCEANGIQLFEMKGVFSNNIYVSRYWVAPWRTDRLRTVHLVFPLSQARELEHYSSLIFPELSSCYPIDA